MKKCSKCKEEKKIIEFSKNKTRKDNHQGECKSCASQRKKQWSKETKWYEENKEIISQKQKQYRQNNREKIKEHQKQYQLDNKDKRNEYLKQKRKEDQLFKLRRNTGNLILASIKRQGYTKLSKTFEILGCSYEEFKSYIENQFTDGMSWENHTTNGWHLDHIIPISYAKTEDDIIRLNHYTNFQPLWAEDNLKKSNKIL
jgi:hypothetical protein